MALKIRSVWLYHKQYLNRPQLLVLLFSINYLSLCLKNAWTCDMLSDHEIQVSTHFKWPHEKQDLKKESNHIPVVDCVCVFVLSVNCIAGTNSSQFWTFFCP